MRRRRLRPRVARLLQRRDHLPSLSREQASANLQPWKPHVETSTVEAPLGAVRLPE